MRRAEGPRGGLRCRKGSGGPTNLREALAPSVKSVCMASFRRMCRVSVDSDVYRKALDRSSPRNWLDDNIWSKKAYHEWRLPLLIHSNWWLVFFNDDRIPEHVLREPIYSELVQITPWQVRRAAWLAFRHLEFRDGLAR